MSKLVNHQEIIDSKKTNKERQKIQTNKKRHLLNQYICVAFVQNLFHPRSPNPQTPTIHPFLGNNKIGRETRAWEKSFVKS